MEVTTDANVCDDGQSDGNALLPPRKRLLAGFKNQGSDGNFALDSLLFASSSTSSFASSNEVDTHLQNILTSHFNDQNLTPEEIAEKSRSAAVTAVKTAKAARAAAEEKAAAAAKAVVAAKSALDLVALFPDQKVSQERNLKKNKLKKHVPVELLYSKHHHNGIDEPDDEVARELRRAINCSGSASKSNLSSERKGYKHTKPQISPAPEKSGIPSGGILLGDSITRKVDFGFSQGEMYAAKMNATASRDEKVVGLGIEKAKASKEKTVEDKSLSASGRRRGRPKIKRGLHSASTAMELFESPTS